MNRSRIQMSDAGEDFKKRLERMKSFSAHHNAKSSCPKCGKGEENKPEICPFDIDIHNKKTFCKCCDDCRDDCNRDR